MKAWLARDLDGELWIYRHWPTRNIDFFYIDEEWCDAESNQKWKLRQNDFPEVTWENSPKLVNAEFQISIINK